MATIGTFTRSTANTYTGAVKTHATLIESDEPGAFNLIWSRRNGH